MLPCLVPVLFAFYLQDVLKFKCKIPAPKGKEEDVSDIADVPQEEVNDVSAAGATEAVELCCAFYCSKYSVGVQGGAKAL